MTKRMFFPIQLILFFFLISSNISAQEKPSTFVKDNYDKWQGYIKMRDGIQLYTIIYSPKDKGGKYPFLINRTPYSVDAYEDSVYPQRIGPNEELMHEKYIFVYQDVRGRYMSEGLNLEVTPYIEKKKSKKDVDESSDTYDTIDWLLKNIKNNNGKAGIYGISYPGFYATAALPGAHPALRAASPQAPVTDEFIGDDANHNGAFFLMDNFGFMNYFDKTVTGPVQDYGSSVFRVRYPDAYQFFLSMGPLSNTIKSPYFTDSNRLWKEYLQHNTYDEYWQSRNIRKHLNNIKVPTLVVGGWFDAEDLFGALRTHEALYNQGGEKNSFLVMAPWAHGAWASKEWEQFGPLDFSQNINVFYHDSLETPFFNYYLKGIGKFTGNTATMFFTGQNEWKKFDTWPPKNSIATDFYFDNDNKLSTSKPGGANSFDEYVSDPKNPVPYIGTISNRRIDAYMAIDQRFAATRPDVLEYSTGVLSEETMLAGKITADLKVSISTTDADFVVKLIDVYPDTTSTQGNMVMGGYQQLVRAEVFRGKFRNSFEKPEPFIPDSVTIVKFDLNDVAHVFKPGHKIMVQVQSSWFPLVDRNPQKFVTIPKATEADFQKATIRIFHDGNNASKIVLPVYKGE